MKIEIGKNVTIGHSANSGISLLGVLTIVFIVLKLTHVITWTWWWVLAPLWIPFLILTVLLAMAFIIYAYVRF